MKTRLAIVVVGVALALLGVNTAYVSAFERGSTEQSADTASTSELAQDALNEPAQTLREMLDAYDPGGSGEIPAYDFEKLRALESDPDFVENSGNTDAERSAAMKRYGDALDEIESSAAEMRDAGELEKLGIPAEKADENGNPLNLAAKAAPVDAGAEVPADASEAEAVTAVRDSEIARQAAETPESSLVPEGSAEAVIDEATAVDPQAPDATTGVLDEFQSKEGWDKLVASMRNVPGAVMANPPLDQPATDSDISANRGINGFDTPDPAGTCTAWPGGPSYNLTSWPAPQYNTVRPGTILYPLQNTYLVPPTPQIPQHQVYSKLGTYGFDTRIVNGVEQFHVIGHLAEQSLGMLLGLHRPLLSVVDGATGTKYAFPVGTPGTEIRIKCYAADKDKTFVTRGVVDAWIPFKTATMSLSEPGFQMRLESVDALTSSPVFFFGGDQRTANVGAPPVGHHNAVSNALAVGVSTDFIHDTNGNPADDLEQFVQSALTVDSVRSMLGSLEGQTFQLGNLPYVFRVNNTDLNGSSADLNTRPTWVPGTSTTDDEYRLWLTAQFSGAKVEGSFAFKVRIKIFGTWITITLKFCYAQVRANIDPVVRTALDVTPPLGITPDTELNTSFHVYYKLLLGGPLCLLANLVPNAIVDNILRPKLESVATDKLEEFGSKTADLLGNLNPSVAVGQSGFKARLTQVLKTCQPLNCNGYKAGDILLGAQGLEPAVDAMVTDLKPSFFGLLPRNFQYSYQPTVPKTAQQIVRDHSNPPYDIAAAINPGLLNQTMRSLVEGRIQPGTGLLDISGSDFWAKPDVPPFYWELPSQKRAFGMILPDFRFGSADKKNSWAMNLYAGADVHFDPATNSLAAGVSVVNPITQVDLQVVQCNLVLYILCTGVPALATTVVNYLSSAILPLLVGNTVGVIRIPQVAGFDLRNVEVSRVAGHLALYADVGASRVWVNGGTGSAGFDFDALADMPGSGPVTTTWTVHDDVSGTPVAFTTSPGIIGPTSHVHVNKADAHPLRIFFWFEVRIVTATVTATRGGVTKTASLQLAILDRV